MSHKVPSGPSIQAKRFLHYNKTAMSDQANVFIAVLRALSRSIST